ncbi:MAG: hypothetical protein AABY22_23055 [Nanoarchaeota archaeon]
MSNSTRDSNNEIGYIHEEQNVIVNYPEPRGRQQKHKIKRPGGKISNFNGV